MDNASAEGIGGVPARQGEGQLDLFNQPTTSNDLEVRLGVGGTDEGLELRAGVGDTGKEVVFKIPDSVVGEIADRMIATGRSGIEDIFVRSIEKYERGKRRRMMPVYILGATGLAAALFFGFQKSKYENLIQDLHRQNIGSSQTPGDPNSGSIVKIVKSATPETHCDGNRLHQMVREYFSAKEQSEKDFYDSRIRQITGGEFYPIKMYSEGSILFVFTQPTSDPTMRKQFRFNWDVTRPNQINFGNEPGYEQRTGQPIEVTYSVIGNSILARALNIALCDRREDVIKKVVAEGFIRPNYGVGTDNGDIFIETAGEEIVRIGYTSNRPEKFMTKGSTKEFITEDDHTLFKGDIASMPGQKFFVPHDYMQKTR